MGGTLQRRLGERLSPRRRSCKLETLAVIRVQSGAVVAED